MKQTFNNWLIEAVSGHASDVHLTVGKPPVFRQNGRLIDKKDEPILTADHTKAICKSIIKTDLYEELKTKGELDFSYDIKDVSRFRVNAFFQRGSLALAIRIVPTTIPTIDSLSLPPVLKDIIHYPYGLVLVTGPTGSGKSTTLASMLNAMNQSMNKHIITLEDPIEFIHQHNQSVIDQREVGFDTQNFVSGLRASLRQDPDVILVGEMRDLETISTAITAAETGHLVLGTLHTASAATTIERMIDVFQPEQQTQIRIQLANILKAVISQRLFITKDQQGRTAATEILINTPAIKNLIRNEKLHQIESVLQTSKDQGMHTFEMDVRRLLQEGFISYETALPYLSDGGFQT